MSAPFPADLLTALCAYLREHPTCQVLLDQHEGVVRQWRPVDGRKTEALTAQQEYATDYAILTETGNSLLT
jgi:hypothetical protein